jgi:hypothetical protein
MRWRVGTAASVLLVLVLLACATPANANMRRGSLAYRHGTERPRIEYRVFWGAVGDDTVRTTKVMVRVTNPERPDSTRNWASITVFVGGVHPDAGEASWDGRAEWSVISASGESGSDDGVDTRRLKAGGAEVVWTTELSLGSGVWKTRYVPTDQRRSDRYETWIRVRFHAPGRTYYWFRLTSPIG